RRSVRRRRDAVRAREARREGADAPESHGEAHFRDRAIRRPQIRGGALETPREQVGVRRLAERAAKLAAEVGTREAGTVREVVYSEWLCVACIGKVPGPQQMAFGRGEDHASSIAVRSREASQVSLPWLFPAGWL